jgi:hypothetical protein
MKILKIILVTVISLAALFFIVGLFLPKTYHVERSIVVNAPDSVVYNNISDFNKFLKWNPWSKMEPSAKVDISGPASQPGHLYKWEGKETGTGQMKIKNVEPSKLVDIELTFLKPFESTADTKFQLEPNAQGTKVTWIMQGNNKSVIEKWMGLSMDSMIGKDFEDGLQNLKTFSEK